jgi:hypothetical protein
MIHLTGATIVQPAGLLSPATLTIDGERISAITPGSTAGGESFDLHDH